jgi:hypothetical protein
LELITIQYSPEKLKQGARIQKSRWEKMADLKIKMESVKNHHPISSPINRNKGREFKKKPLEKMAVLTSKQNPRNLCTTIIKNGLFVSTAHN